MPTDGEQTVLAGDSFVRRVRALLHTRPLHALELNKGSRGKAKFEPYDLLTLQLAAIEHITDHQSPNRGVPVEEVEDELARVAGAMAPKRPRSEHREVAVVVLAGLENEGEGAFLLDYRDPTSPSEWQRTDVRLLNADQADDGSIEVRATPQAINLLLDVMDVDIESAEKAMHFMFTVQVKGGRLSRAAETAERMRRLSQAYQESIQQALTAAARDIGEIDWSGMVMGEIDRAYAHVEERLTAEADVLDDVAERAAAATEPDERRTLARIRELLDECNRHHRELHVQLMDARSTLLEHHASQRIAPPPSVATVAPRAELLEPTLALALRDSDDVLSRFAAGLVPALPAGLPNLGRLVDHLWRAQIERGTALRPVEVADLDEDRPPAPIFTDAAIEFARQLLARSHREARLSDLLREASGPSTPAGAVYLVASGALQAFMETGGIGPQQDDEESWRLVPKELIAELAGADLAHADFAGDELLLTRLDERSSHDA
jgi:hypothetical protein